MFEFHLHFASYTTKYLEINKSETILEIKAIEIAGHEHDKTEERPAKNYEMIISLRWNKCVSCKHDIILYQTLESIQSRINGFSIHFVKS